TFDSATFLTALRWSVPGEWITATATDPGGNTSEFSLAFQTSLNSALLAVTGSTGSSVPGTSQATAALDQFFAERALTPTTDLVSADILSALLSLEKERGAGRRG